MKTSWLQQKFQLMILDNNISINLFKFLIIKINVNFYDTQVYIWVNCRQVTSRIQTLSKGGQKNEIPSMLLDEYTTFLYLYYLVHLFGMN